MGSFQTRKGTELPLLDLRGNAYLQVAFRLVWFREDHPLGRIETEVVTATQEYAICRAKVSIPNERGEYLLLATATKREDYKHFQDFIEKCETAAVGRALAMVGYGTQFAPDLDEGDRIVDSPIQPGRPAAKINAPLSSGKAESSPPKVVTKPETPPTETKPQAAPDMIQVPTTEASMREQLNKQVDYLYLSYMSKFPENRLLKILETRYGVNDAKLCTLEELNDLLKFMTAGLEGKTYTAQDAVSQDRIEIEAKLAEVTKKMGKDSAWLDTQFQKSFKRGMSDCSPAQLRRALSKLEERV